MVSSIPLPPHNCSEWLNAGSQRESGGWKKSSRAKGRGGLLGNAPVEELLPFPLEGGNERVQGSAGSETKVPPSSPNKQAKLRLLFWRRERRKALGGSRALPPPPPHLVALFCAELNASVKPGSDLAWLQSGGGGRRRACEEVARLDKGSERERSGSTAQAPQKHHPAACLDQTRHFPTP